MDVKVSLPFPTMTCHNSLGEMKTEPIARLRRIAISRKKKEKRYGAQRMVIAGAKHALPLHVVI